MKRRTTRRRCCGSNLRKRMAGRRTWGLADALSRMARMVGATTNGLGPLYRKNVRYIQNTKQKVTCRMQATPVPRGIN